MSKIISIEEAFKLENLDINAVSVKGIPERHVEAVIAFAKLIVGADHADGDGVLDFTNYSQDKFSVIAEMGSPSGVGFSYRGYDGWNAGSHVGARLSFKKRETAKNFFTENLELYKKFMVYERKLGK